jgi:hypothetical protein
MPNPIALPVETPTSLPLVPEIVVVPVFVTSLPARTPYLDSVPWMIVTATDDGIRKAAVTATIKETPVMDLITLTFLFLFFLMTAE